jgi:hypothetical protein
MALHRQGLGGLLPQLLYDSFAHCFRQDQAKAWFVMNSEASL